MNTRNMRVSRCVAVAISHISSSVTTLRSIHCESTWQKFSHIPHQYIGTSVHQSSHQERTIDTHSPAGSYMGKKQTPFSIDDAS